MTVLSVIITETVKKGETNMRKWIAVLMVLMMILGTACALAEEEEEIEDLTGGWELYAGGQSELYVYLERDGTFRSVSSEDTWDRDSITEGTWTYDGTELTLAAENETLSFIYTLPDGCETGGGFAGEKDGMPISLEEIDTYEVFDVFRMGLWNTPEDPAITPERQAVYDAAMQYQGPPVLKPMLYLASWGEDGIGHAFLSQSIPEDPDDKPEWVIVFIHGEPDTMGIEVWDEEVLDLDKYCIFSSNG